MKIKAYKIEVLVLDFNNCGEYNVRSYLCKSDFLNVDVKSIQSKEIDWSDDHPLNKPESCELTYKELFE